MNGEALPDRPARAVTRRAWLFAAALLVVTILAYIPALRADFIWDDDSYVTENPALREGLSGLAGIWVPRTTPQYYPLVFTAFWIEWQIWEDNPLGYHLVNVVLHAVNALLLAFVLFRIGVKQELAWGDRVPVRAAPGSGRVGRVDHGAQECPFNVVLSPRGPRVFEI